MVTQKSKLYIKLFSTLSRVRLMSCILSQLNTLCTSLVKSHYTENDQRQGCKAFIDLYVHAQIVGGGRLLLSKILNQSEPPPSKTVLFQSIFAHSITSITASYMIVTSLCLCGAFLRHSVECPTLVGTPSIINAITPC